MLTADAAPDITDLSEYPKSKAPEMPSGRKYRLFGGILRFTPFVLAFWVIVFGAVYAFWHQHHPLTSPTRIQVPQVER